MQELPQHTLKEGYVSSVTQERVTRVETLHHYYPLSQSCMLTAREQFQYSHLHKYEKKETTAGKPVLPVPNVIRLHQR